MGAPIIDQAPSYGPGQSELQYAGTVPNDFVTRHPPVELLVETDTGSDEFAPLEGWDWSGIHVGRDGDETTATLTLPVLDGTKLDTEHFVDHFYRFGTDRRVRIQIALGASSPIILFEGYPQPVTASFDEGKQSMSVTAISVGHEVMRNGETSQVLGRTMLFDPEAEYEPFSNAAYETLGLEARFNPDGKPNRRKDVIEMPWPDGPTPPEPPLTQNGRSIYVFTHDGEPNAKKWTYVQALRHVLWHYAIERGQKVSTTEFLRDTAYLATSEPIDSAHDPFDRLMTQHVDNVSVSGMNLEEAIAALCEQAGLHYEIATRTKRASDGLTTGSGEAEYFLRVWAEIGTLLEEDSTPPRYMRGPKGYDLPRQRPFGLSPNDDPIAIASRNRMQQANITIDYRAINHVIVLGARRKFEVTLILRPGWKPHEKLDNLSTTEQQEEAEEYWDNQFDPEFDDDGLRVPTSIYHRLHPNHHTVADVFRTWIFPDTSEYADEGYAREHYPEALYSPLDVSGAMVLVRDDIGGAIPFDEVTQWILRRRPFLDLIGRPDKHGPRREPIVRVNFHSSTPYAARHEHDWVVYGGQVQFDKERARLTFEEASFLEKAMVIAGGEDDGTPFYKKYIRGQMWVSVTCSIEADTRLQSTFDVSGAGFGRRRTAVKDTGYKRYQYNNRRGQNSHLNALAMDEAEFEDRDDSEALDRYARELAYSTAYPTVSGDPEIFWLAPEYRPGDYFTGCEGLGLAFARYPGLKSVEFEKGPQGYRTRLMLEDYRHAPETGIEA